MRASVGIGRRGARGLMWAFRIGGVSARTMVIRSTCHETIRPVANTTRLARTVQHLSPCTPHRGRPQHVLALPPVRDRCAFSTVSALPVLRLCRACTAATGTRLRSSDHRCHVPPSRHPRHNAHCSQAIPGSRRRNAPLGGEDASPTGKRGGRLALAVRAPCVTCPRRNSRPASIPTELLARLVVRCRSLKRAWNAYRKRSHHRRVGDVERWVTRLPGTGHVVHPGARSRIPGRARDRWRAAALPQ